MVEAKAPKTVDCWACWSVVGSDKPKVDAKGESSVVQTASASAARLVAWKVRQRVGGKVEASAAKWDKRMAGWKDRATAASMDEMSAGHWAAEKAAEWAARMAASLERQTAVQTDALLADKTADEMERK